jgi:hypothetical protein
MEDFTTLHTTLNQEQPPSRSLRALQTLLAKAYELANNHWFSDTRLFNSPADSPLQVSRTTVERLLLAVDQLAPSSFTYQLTSKNVEQILDDLHTAETLIAHAPSGSEHLLRLQLAGMLAAQLRRLTDLVRHGLLMLSQRAVQEALAQLPDDARRVRYLKQLLLAYQQRADQYDQPFYQDFRKFLKLEKKQWQLALTAPAAPQFTTTEELQRFIVELLGTVVEHRVRYHDGYKNFWRDEQCTQDKKEEEVQQYLHALLEPPCRQRGVQLHRETAAAGGFVDMTFTYLSLTVCLEIKKAQHAGVEYALNTQLVAYMQAANTQAGIYLVLWLRPPVSKAQAARYASPAALADYLVRLATPNYQVATYVLDCTKPTNPSKLLA